MKRLPEIPYLHCSTRFWDRCWFCFSSPCYSSTICGVTVVLLLLTVKSEHPTLAGHQVLQELLEDWRWRPLSHYHTHSCPICQLYNYALCIQCVEGACDHHWSMVLHSKRLCARRSEHGFIPHWKRTTGVANNALTDTGKGIIIK